MAKGKKTTSIAAADPDAKWRAESDHRTLREAEEIKGDKNRLGAAAAHAKSQVEQNAKVAALHKRGLISNKVLNRIKGFFTPDQGAQNPTSMAPDAGQEPQAQPVAAATQNQNGAT
jgi:ABC-type thiamine transport system ATPase subunit